MITVESGMKVLVRTYSSGVHFGEVVKYSPEYGVMELKNARRLRRWRLKNKKGSTVAEIAIVGLDSSFTEVCAAIPKFIVSEVIEIIPCPPKISKEIEVWEVYIP